MIVKIFIPHQLFNSHWTESLTVTPTCLGPSPRTATCHLAPPTAKEGSRWVSGRCPERTLPTCHWLASLPIGWLPYYAGCARDYFEYVFMFEKKVLWHSVVLKHQNESRAYGTKVSTLGTLVLTGKKALLPPTGSNPSPVDSEGSVPAGRQPSLTAHPDTPFWGMATSPLPSQPPSPQCAPQNRINMKLQSLCKEVQWWLPRGSSMHM